VARASAAKRARHKEREPTPRPRPVGSGSEEEEEEKVVPDSWNQSMTDCKVGTFAVIESIYDNDARGISLVKVG